jgi:hypothetical protein
MQFDDVLSETEERELETIGRQNNRRLTARARVKGNNRIRKVTIFEDGRPIKTYNGNFHPDHERYWLRKLKKEFEDDIFRQSSAEKQAAAKRRYGANAQ